MTVCHLHQALDRLELGDVNREGDMVLGLLPIRVDWYGLRGEQRTVALSLLCLFRYLGGDDGSG